MANSKEGFEIMKMKTRTAIKKAGAGRRPAGRHKLRCEAYRKPAPLSRSNLKENLGLLLCHLQSPLTQQQRRIGWQLFEVLLRQYLQSLTEYVSEYPRAAGIEKVGAVRLNGQE